MGACLEGMADADAAVDASRARLALARPEAGDAFFVAPGERVCLFRETQAGAQSTGTCATREQIDSAQAYMMSDLTDDLAEGWVRISGLAPDGVSAVRVQLAGGEMVTIPVIGNVFVAEMAGRADQEPSIELLTEPVSEVEDDEATGGCSAGQGASGASGLLALFALVTLTRRRRRQK